MTLVERIASAIAASRTGTIDGWRAYRPEALRIIDANKALAAVQETDSADRRFISNDR